jgi:hypothetical protein
MGANPAVPYRLDWSVPAAVVCLVCAWFFMSSLIMDLGAAELRFRFYDMLTLMRAPVRIATGPVGEGATWNARVFGAICAAALLAALAPLVSTRRAAWLGCLAPMALMALCGAILYHSLARELVADSGFLGETGSRLSHLANSLANTVGALVSRRVHVGWGGYLALAAGVFLAVKGLQGYRRAP